MPKKVTIASGISLVLLMVLIIVLANVAARTQKSALPQKITVYLQERGEIATLDYSEFLEGCLRGFLPENGYFYEPQTLEALGVVVNTNVLYALKNRDKFENFGADIATSEIFPYVDYSDKAINHTDRALVENAAKSVGKKHFLLDGEPVLLDFCRISCGRTSAKPPAMPSVNLPSDVLCEGFISQNAYTQKEVLALSEIKRLREPPEEWFTEPIYDEYGTLSSIKISNQKISGEFIKNTLGLRSAAISISYEDDCFMITCKGWGNNTGMSLAAADAMSREGKSAEEILALFYCADLQEE